MHKPGRLAGSWTSLCAAAALCLLLVTVLWPLEGENGRVQAEPAASRWQGPIRPNASLLTARVLKYSVWDPVLLNFTGPGAFYSLVLDVCRSESVGEEANLVAPGDRIEVFSKELLAPELLGKTIRARVRAQGDERGQRFWVRDIRVLESDQDCSAGAKKVP